MPTYPKVAEHDCYWSKAERRALSDTLKPLEATEVRFVDDCTAEAMKTSDLVVVRRREFLKADLSLVVATLDQLKAGDLRRFEVISYAAVAGKVAAEDKERMQIADDVKAGARNTRHLAHCERLASEASLTKSALLARSKTIASSTSTNQRHNEHVQALDRNRSYLPGCQPRARLTDGSELAKTGP